MANKKVFIIGAGIAGLCAGSYLQMNGYDTEIFEAHSISGGLCTSWKRKGYTFDGCVHSICGLNPKFIFNKYWNELVDLAKMEFVFHEQLSQIELATGEVVHFYVDPEKLERELLAIAPEDELFIRGFIKDIKKMEKFDTQQKKPLELWTPLDYYLSQFRTAPYIGTLIKWSKGIIDITKHCKSTRLKAVLNSDFFSHYPAYFFIISLGQMHVKNAGYPIGGSLAFARLIEQRYRELGGKIHFNAKVAKINVLNDQAVGITLVNGDVRDGADTIISAADSHSTIYEFLEGKYIDKKIMQRFKTYPLYPSVLLVSLGIARTFPDEPPLLLLPAKYPIAIDDKLTLDKLNVTLYNFDPTLAPAGKTYVRVIVETTNIQYWENLRASDPVKYQQEKDRIASDIIATLDQRFEHIAENVEVVDVATPATLKRYTYNWQGSSQGWEWLPGTIPKIFKKELPNLKGFFQIGQWVMPGGGLPTALVTGRDVAQIICRRDKKKFVTTNATKD